MTEYIEREAAIKGFWAGLDDGSICGPGDTANYLGGIPAADVAPVRHGVPMLGVRMERFEVYNPAGMLDGIEVFKLRIITVEKALICVALFAERDFAPDFSTTAPTAGRRWTGRWGRERLYCDHIWREKI